MLNTNLQNKISLYRGNFADYKTLARYHYQPTLTFPPTMVYKIAGVGDSFSTLPNPIAVIVFTQPFPDIESRAAMTANYYHAAGSLSENLQSVNRDILYLARLIVDPRFQKQGIASYLLHETLEQLNIPIVETLTPIDFTNKMYQREGFLIHYQKPSARHIRLMNAFESIGLKVTETTTPLLIEGRLNNLDTVSRETIEREIDVFLKQYRNADRFQPGIERTKFILTKVPPPAAYLIWFNPRNAHAQALAACHSESRLVGTKNLSVCFNAPVTP
jgi:GNAT superfamily N-acetyltransferase